MADQKNTILIKLDVDSDAAKKKVVENTTSIRNLGTANKELQKQLKANEITEEQYTQALIQNKAATDALKNENKQLELSLKATENSVEGLRAQIALLTTESNKLDLNSEEFVEAQARLKGLNDALREVGEDRSDFRTNVGNYGSAVRGFEDHIASLEQKLNGLRIDSKEFQQTRDEIAKTRGELDKLQSGVGGIEGKLNDFGNKLSGAFSGFGNLGTTLTAALGPAAILGGVTAVTAGLIKLKTAIDADRQQVNLLTGATGGALDKITAKTSATAKTFSKDFNETLVTANTYAKQFGISVPQALDNIQKGFVAGADATGNFLGDLTEFSPQFKAIGVSAEEAIAILSQQPESGVFSNKGIDAIKEAGLRLKEMPDATKQALDAIGLSSKEIQASIQDGTLTTFQAIQKVSNQLATIPGNSKQAAEAVANIFGGAGQDAGLEYLKTIGSIETSLDAVTDKAGEFADANLKIVKAQERIDLLLNQVLGGGGDMFNNLKAAALDFAANALEFIVNGIVEVINWFRQLYNESVVFRGSIQLLKVGFENTWASIKFIFNQFMTQLKAVGALFKAVFTGNFKAIPGIVNDALKQTVDSAKSFGKEVAQNYADGWEETINPKELLEPIKLEREEVVTEFYGAGQAAGNAFNAGIKQTRAEYLEDQKAFYQAQLLLADKNSQQALELTKKIIQIDRDLQLEAEGLTANQKLLIRTQAIVDEAAAEEAFLQDEKARQAKAIEDAIKLIEDGEARKAAALAIARANSEISEEDYQQRLYDIREEALVKEIGQLEEGTLAKIQKEAELAQLRSDQVAAARQKEIETSNLLRDTEVNNDEARLEAATTLAQGIADIATETSTAGKIAAAVAKGLAVADVIFQLQQELAANAAAGAKISAQAAPYTVAAGVTYTTTRNILAGVRAGVSVAKIGATLFDDGGQAFSDNLALNGGSLPRYGGMISGAPHGQGGVKFRMGSGLGEADGRKGEAYIVNTSKNPMLKALASQLNVAGGGRAFFNAGGVIQYAGGGVTTGVNASSLVPQAQTDFQTILENLPTPVVLVDDIYNGVAQKTAVENGAIL